MPVQILIMRHGAAVDSRQAASDAQRHLTAQGRSDVARVAEALRAGGLVPTAVHTSPYVRAVQTAEAVAHTLGLEGPVPAHPALVPGGSSAALEVLENYGDGDRVLLVSHEPTVRVLSAELGGFDFPPFPTGGVAVFELDEARHFLGRLDPRVGWRDANDRGY